MKKADLFRHRCPGRNLDGSCGETWLSATSTPTECPECGALSYSAPQHPPERAPYFQPFYYTRSGRVRVGRRGTFFRVEVKVSPTCWAILDGRTYAQEEVALAYAHTTDPAS